MTASVSVPAWTLRMGAGATQNWTFTFTTTAPGGNTPYSIQGATWEYVARTSVTDNSSSPLIKVTTSASAAGLITVTSTATLSQVLLQIYPAATSSLTPGQYWHALWMNPGTTTAVPVFGGQESLLLIDGTTQP